MIPGDFVKVVSSEYIELVGQTGQVKLMYFESGTCLVYFPNNEDPIVQATVSKLELEIVKTPARAEAPCPLRGCGRPNDFGVATCWNCGNAL